MANFTIVKHAPVLLLIFRFCIAPAINAQTLDIEKEIGNWRKHNLLLLYNTI
jgi:hypothetical protein